MITCSHGSKMIMDVGHRTEVGGTTPSVTVQHLDLEAGLVQCRTSNWMHSDERDGPVESAVRPRHLIPLDEDGKELRHGQAAFIPSAEYDDMRPPAWDASGADPPKGKKGEKGSGKRPVYEAQRLCRKRVLAW